MIWHWISQKWYEIDTLQWNSNKNLHVHTPNSWVSFRMTSSDLGKYSVTWSVVRPLCDRRACCCCYFYCCNCHDTVTDAALSQVNRSQNIVTAVSSVASTIETDTEPASCCCIVFNYFLNSTFNCFMLLLSKFVYVFVRRSVTRCLCV